MTHLGWYTRGYLPHCDAPGALQAITFRLADSLPLDVLKRMEWDVESFPEDEKSRGLRKRINDWLDTGHGSCILSRPECAAIVVDAFRFFHKERYELIAWVVMPNHVHLVIQQHDGWSLGGVIRSWKGFTTKKIKDVYGGSLPEKIWQRGFWDRLIRNEHHYEAALRYIADNPVKAGLVAYPLDWPWMGLPEQKEPHRSAALHFY